MLLEYLHGHGLVPATAAAVIFLVMAFHLTKYITSRKNVIHIDLHAYQDDFLAAFATAKTTTKNGALTLLVERAMDDKDVFAQVFDDFHCVHCGGVNPAGWIKERKGQKKPYSFEVTARVRRFLDKPLLVKVEKVGNPPKKTITDAQNRRSDVSKAARCCIDWAIKNYGALSDGKPKKPEPPATKKAKLS